MENGEKIERERLHKEEIAIAQLTSIYTNSQKTKPPYTSPLDFCLFKPTEIGLPVKLCNTFFELAEEGILPSWAALNSPFDKLENGRDKVKGVSTPRAWTTLGLILICPVIGDSNYVSIGLAILDDGSETNKKYQVWDVDSNESFYVYVPAIAEQSNLNVTWMYEVKR